MFPDSDPHWARQNLVFYVLCARVNILCKHVQMCVCVCVCVCMCVCVLRHVYGHGNKDRQHEIWSRHQSSENFKV